MSITVDPEWWKTLFDEVYLQTDARSVCDDDLTRREIDVVLKMLPIRRDHRILDLCGGHGRHSLELCARGYSGCTLLDFSKVLIGHARTRATAEHAPLDCICGDARSTGLSSGCFDQVLILGNSLGYTLSKGADRQILEEAYRVLTADGWLLVDVTDGRAIRQSFKPSSWHEIDDDMVVCRRRELQGDKLAARELVMSKTSGLIRDENYAVTLYDNKTLKVLLGAVGFINITVHDDFTPHQSDGDYGFMNHRLLATGQKP